MQDGVKDVLEQDSSLTQRLLNTANLGSLAAIERGLDGEGQRRIAVGSHF